MRVIVAGSRSIADPDAVATAIERSGFQVTEVVCGEAQGVDTLGRAWAEVRGIPVTSFPAKWAAHGKAAGRSRNVKMAHYADALVAVWDGESRGTAHMIACMRALARKPVFVYTP